MTSEFLAFNKFFLKKILRNQIIAYIFATELLHYKVFQIKSKQRYEKFIQNM